MFNNFSSPERVEPTPHLRYDSQGQKKVILSQPLLSAQIPQSSPQQEQVITQKYSKPYKSIFQDSFQQKSVLSQQLTSDSAKFRQVKEVQEVKKIKSQEISSPPSIQEFKTVQYDSPAKPFQVSTLDEQYKVKSSIVRNADEVRALSEMQSFFQQELLQQKQDMKSNFESILERIDSLSQQFQFASSSKRLGDPNHENFKLKQNKQYQPHEFKYGSQFESPKQDQRKSIFKATPVYTSAHQTPETCQTRNPILFSSEKKKKIQKPQKGQRLNGSMSNSSDLGAKLDKLQFQSIQNEEDIYSYFRQKYGRNLKRSSVYPLQSIFKIPQNDNLNFVFCTLCEQFVEMGKTSKHSQYCFPKTNTNMGFFETFCGCTKPQINQQPTYALQDINTNIQKIVYLLEKFSLSQLQQCHRIVRNYCRFGIRIASYVSCENLNKTLLESYLHDLKLLFLALDQLLPNLQLVFLLQKAVALTSEKISIL